MSYIILFAAVIVGAVLVYVYKPDQKGLRLLLAFSGAYLLAITVLHLLPGIYENSNFGNGIGLLILFGILLQSILESFSKGIEHGHSHLKGQKGTFHFVFFGSLCIHSLLEGMPVLSSNESLVWAIAIHKLPIAIVLTAFFIQKELSKLSITIALFIFALMSPLGTFLGDKIEILNNYMPEITAVVVGIFFHISTVILFESTENHKFNIKKFGVIVLGFLISYLSM